MTPGSEDCEDGEPLTPGSEQSESGQPQRRGRRPKIVNRPTKQEWDKHWPIITELYFREGESLERVIKIMGDQYNFHANSRQYKGKFSKADQQSKRIRAEQYLAMVVILEDFKKGGHHHHDLYFKAARGGRPVTVTSQQIYKEIGRSRKQRQGRNATSPYSYQYPMSVAQARDELEIHHVEGPFSRSSPASKPLPSHYLDPHRPTIHSSIMSTSVGSPEAMTDASTVASPGSCVTPGHSPMPVMEPVSKLPISLSGMSYKFNALNSSATTNGVSVRNRLPDGSRGRGLLPPPTQRMDEGHERAYKWAQPFIDAAFKPDMPFIGARKKEALDNLSTILRVHPLNEWIFPYMNRVFTIFSSNNKWPQLREFTMSSRDVIESVPEAQPLACPFNYMLAYYDEDEERIRKYEKMFEATQNLLMDRCTEDHPNILINCYYQAWILLANHRRQAAIDLLEKTLQKVSSNHNIGDTNLVTINCMVMLSRAYAENQEHEKAIFFLEGPINNLDDMPSDDMHYLQPFKASLLVRLAESRSQIGDLSHAEVHFRHACALRTEFLGRQDASTWAAIWALAETLRKLDRATEAAELLHEENELRKVQQQKIEYYPWPKTELTHSLWEQRTQRERMPSIFDTMQLARPSGERVIEMRGDGDMQDVRNSTEFTLNQRDRGHR
jgi:tetratricopeptide (TPR) repeat protein